MANGILIYRATCLVNGKCYVGKSNRSLEERIKNHLYTVKRGSKSAFHCAIRKHGVESFKWEILDKALFVDMLSDMEIFYICKNKCIVPNGYNMTAGGEGSLGYVPSIETREKMSKMFSGENNPFYGKKHTEETRNAIREKRLGKKVGPFSDDHKKKISDALKGKKKSKEAVEHMIAAKTGKNTGEDNPFWGRHHTEETKEKIRLKKVKK